ncbi:MAG: hypothetical protein ACRDAG_01240 [Cetobacterium somerae]|uniref:hypothetical protein n=1 Tax=Cetobacterium somerae TaxID=188913 RepID=UPI003F323CF1
MRMLKNVMEAKFERVVELVKEWADLGICSRNSLIDVNCRFDTKEKVWIVTVWGDEEIADTVEQGLDKWIEYLTTAEEYVEAKKREMVGDRHDQ